MMTAAKTFAIAVALLSPSICFAQTLALASNTSLASAGTHTAVPQAAIFTTTEAMPVVLVNSVKPNYQKLVPKVNGTQLSLTTSFDGAVRVLATVCNSRGEVICVKEKRIAAGVKNINLTEANFSDDTYTCSFLVTSLETKSCALYSYKLQWQ
ncbi:MAG: hypothetical protein RL660_2813 [Bacteroidota bacterium]|jgi:hypothetical protein